VWGKKNNDFYFHILDLIRTIFRPLKPGNKLSTVFFIFDNSKTGDNVVNMLTQIWIVYILYRLDQILNNRLTTKMKKKKMCVLYNKILKMKRISEKKKTKKKKLNWKDWDKTKIKNLIM
jgi:hypothetical protein